MDGESSVTAPASALAAALRRAGAVRLAIGFFVMCFGSALLAERLVGAHGLWLRAYGSAGAGGTGIAFAWIWAYFTGVRLTRGRSWPRALSPALLPAGAMIVLVSVIRQVLDR